MKKILLVLLIALLTFSAFAIDGFSFEAVNQTPLFREPIADPYSFNSHVYVVYDAKSNPDYEFRTLVSDGENAKSSIYRYVDLPYKGDAKANLLINMRLAGNANALHFTFDTEKLPKLEFELNLAGSINTLFVLSGGNETLDFDGSFFVGGTTRVADFLSVRFGIHHFSAHWGDESLEKFYEHNKINPSEATAITVGDETLYYRGLIEYVRDNSWLLGVSADLPLGFRLYSELEIPKHVSWLRPFIHTPADYKNSGDDKNNNSGSIRTGNVEGIYNNTQIKAESTLKDGGYAALRIHGGVEWRKDIGFADLVLSTDIQAHQDGKTNHQIGEYSKKNPWDWEFTTGASLEFADALAGQKTLSLDAFYHYGRTPATQFFYRTGNFVYFGIGIR